MSKYLIEAMEEFKTNYHNLLKDGLDLSNFIKSKSEDFKRGHVNEANLEKTLNRLVDDLDFLSSKAIEARASYMEFKWEKEREQNHNMKIEDIFSNHTESTINGKLDME